MVTQSLSTGHIASDPLRNFKFRVLIQNTSGNIKGISKLGFMSVSGLNITTEVIPYREGGSNTTTQKMPGQSDFAPITLSKGLAVGADATMMNWMKQLFKVQQGTGTQGSGAEFRCLVDIQILDHPNTSSDAPVKAWFRVYNAWPTAIAFSDLDAGANAIVIQQLTLAHEGFDFKLAASQGTDAVSF